MLNSHWKNWCGSWSSNSFFLKLQFFGHLMWRADSLEKTLMLGKIEGRRRRGWQRIRYLDGITDSMDMNLSKHLGIVQNREAWHAVVHGGAKSQIWLSDWTIATAGFVIAFLPRNKHLHKNKAHKPGILDIGGIPLALPWAPRNTVSSLWKHEKKGYYRNRKDPAWTSSRGHLHLVVLWVPWLCHLGLQSKSRPSLNLCHFSSPTFLWSTQ